MRKGLTTSFIIVLIGLLLTGIWLANLVWFKPLNIDHFFERVYIEFLWNDPEALSQTGILKSYGLNHYKSELTDVSPAATRRLAEIGRNNLDLLERYDRNNLSSDQQVSYDAFYWFLNTGVSGEPFLFHDYPVSHISGSHLEIERFMRNHPLDTKHDIENYLMRLNAIDEKFGGLVDALEERRKLGVVAPTFILKKAYQFCDQIASLQAENNVFYTSFEERLSRIGLLNPKSKEAYLQECLDGVNESVLPAYKRLAAYLLQLERSSLSIAGVWQLPNGKEYYQFCLLQNTGVNNNPDELYELGKLEMNRLKGELQILLELAGEPVMEDVSISLQELSNNSDFTFDTTSQGRAACLDFFSERSSDISGLLPKFFGALPQVSLAVKELPQNRSSNSPLALYIPPRGEPLSEGKFYVNTWKTQNLTKHLATSYAYHEGIPGHHLQKGIQAELTDLPTFRRFLPFESYTEGWAMYAEQLGHEMTGSEDLWDKIGLLQSDLFRSTRMMTDIGIHHKKWLRQQAIDFMIDNAGLTNSEAESEVDRYIVWPGQGCAYKVGQLKFLELRRLAQSELRDKFDIREFHDVLIGQGAMPLEVLERRVEEYIQQKKQGG